MTGSAKNFVFNLLADSSKAEKTFDGFVSIAKASAVGVAAAWATAKIGEGIEKSFAFESVGNLATSQLGLMPAEAERVGRLTGESYTAGISGSLEETSDAYVSVLRNVTGLGDASDAELSRYAANTAALSQSMSEDVAKINGAVGTMTKSGIVKDIDEAYDVIARGSQLGVDKQQDLLDTFTEYSVIFDQLGLDATDALGLMNQAIEGGARNSDVAADALKEFVIRAQEAMSTPVDTDAIESAQQRVVDATEAVAEVQEQSAERVRTAQASIVDANRSAADANAAAAERTEAAEDSLRRAQDDSRESQISLSQARRDAADDLQNLADQVANGDLSLRGAELAVTRARSNLQKVNNDNDASGLDRSEAQLAYDRAVQALAEQKDRVADLAQQKEEADEAGVNGSKRVLDAEKKVSDARKAERDAEKSVAEAEASQRQTRRDGLADIAEATRELATVQKENAESAADAFAAVQQAQTDLADASVVKLTAIGQAYADLGLDGAAMQAAIAAGGPGAKDALTQTLDALNGVEDPATRAQLSIVLFGTKSEDMQKALKNFDTATMRDGLGQIEGAAQGMGTALGSGMQADITSGQRQLEALWQGISDLPGPMRDFVVQAMVFGPSVGGIVSAVGPLVLLLGGSGLSAVKGFAIGIGALGKAFLLSPVTWIVLGIVAAVALLAAGVVWVVQNWDGIVEFFSGLWQNIWTGIQTFIGWVVEGFLNFTPLGLIIKYWGPISEFIGGLWDTIWKGIQTFFGWVVDGFLNFTPLGLIIKNWGGITEFFGDFWGNIQDGAGAAADWLSVKIAEIISFFTSIPDSIGKGWDGLVGLVQDVVKGIARATADLWNGTIGAIDVTMPDWLGGAHIKFPKMEVPFLAKGGIVTSPTLAMIGEAGTEAVVPLSKAGQFGFGGGGGSTRPIEITTILKIGARELWRELKKVQAKEAR